MRTRLSLLMLFLVLASCSKSPEIVEGPLTRELLHRHIVERGPIRYSEDDYFWKCEEMLSVTQHSSFKATVEVRESGHKVKVVVRDGFQKKEFERKKGESGAQRAKREIELSKYRNRNQYRTRYGETERTAKFGVSRVSVNEFWRVEHCNWILKLKTGPYVALEKPEEPVQIAKPVPAPKEPKKVEPVAESPPPEPAVKPQLGIPEAIPVTTPELSELRAQLESLEIELMIAEALGYPDTVVLKTGKKMEGEILVETEDSIRIRTDSGTATMSKERIESIDHATESEKAQAIEAKSKCEEIRRQIDNIQLRIAEIEAPPVEPEKKPDLSSKEEFIAYVKAGDQAIVGRYLENGMKVDVRDHNRRTPLMLAAFEGHDEIVVTLLDAGAKLEARDVDGWTALMYAAYGGRDTTTRLFIDKGANVNAKIKSGQTVLRVAMQKGDQNVIRILEQAGAKK